MSVFAEWRAARERRERATNYLATLQHDPPAADIEWLRQFSQLDDESARREVRTARRAIALIVAERDALDDRTAADVAHRLDEIVREEARRETEAARSWADKWRAYSGALNARGTSDAPATRIARVLLSSVGVSSPTPEQLSRATQWVVETRSHANEALRTAFGAASLPEDVKPSAIKPAR